MSRAAAVVVDDEPSHWVQLEAADRDMSAFAMTSAMRLPVDAGRLTFAQLRVSLRICGGACPTAFAGAPSAATLFDFRGVLQIGRAWQLVYDAGTHVQEFCVLLRYAHDDGSQIVRHIPLWGLRRALCDDTSTTPSPVAITLRQSSATGEDVSLDWYFPARPAARRRVTAHDHGTRVPDGSASFGPASAAAADNDDTHPAVIVGALQRGQPAVSTYVSNVMFQYTNKDDDDKTIQYQTWQWRGHAPSHIRRTQDGFVHIMSDPSSTHPFAHALTVLASRYHSAPVCARAQQTCAANVRRHNKKVRSVVWVVAVLVACFVVVFAGLFWRLVRQTTLRQRVPITAPAPTPPPTATIE